MIQLTQEILTDLQAAASREWLETNGIGGYASGTVAGINARRYHGHLVAADKPPLGRAVLLSKLEETLIIDGERYDLSCNRYPGAIHPRGFEFLTGFRLDPFPIWNYLVAGAGIEKALFMVHGENTVVITWAVKNKPENVKSLDLELRPLLAFRDHHHLRTDKTNFDPAYTIEAGRIYFEPVSSMPPLFVSSNSESIEPTGSWYRNFEYPIEMERGFDHHEDLFQPCVLSFDLSEPAIIVASTIGRDHHEAEEFRRIEMKRRAMIVAKAGAADNFSSQLALAADQFIVSRGAGKTVIAGYHWFSDWGRDTMIALNGLTLATGRPEIAKSILSEFAGYLSEGMLPNRFPDEADEPEYNTVDATLWFFEAIRAYADRTGDDLFVKEILYAKLSEVVDWHVRGTRYGIHVDSDGLLYAGEPGVQLTWMDAKIGEWVVTPRTGKAVEIQALWYNALCIMAGFASKFGDENGKHRYMDMAAIASDSFNGQFWNEADECLYDVVDGDQKDAAIRPNQIFAVSLLHTMLDPERAQKVVAKVEAELLTPFGLRSLSPNDPSYVPHYIGSPFDRDAAYHQGTVWGWLIGPFVDAYKRVHSDDPRSGKRIEEMVSGYKQHLSEAMVGQISEIFDAEPPHAARGAAAQAWSVAELFRILSTLRGEGTRF